MFPFRIVVFGAAAGLGAGSSALGCGIPMIAKHLNLPLTSIGQMFFFRGVGGMCGALLSEKLLALPTLCLSRHAVCSTAVIIAGIAVMMVPTVAQFDSSSALNGVRALFLIQGVCFGVMESFAAVAISSMWGQRQLPWMLTKGIMSSAGAIVSPVLMKFYGLQVAYVLIAVLGFSTLGGLVAEKVVDWLIVENTADDTWESLTQEGLIDAPNGDSGRKKSRRISFDMSAIQAINKKSGVLSPAIEVMQAEELNLLTDTLAAVDDDSELENDPSRQSLVEEVLISSTGSGRRRSLSYATPQIVDSIAKREAQFQVVLVPFSARLLLAVFVCWHVGLSYSYGSWVGTFMILADITSPIAKGAVAAGLFVSTINCVAQLIGSFYAVPVSMLYSTTTLLRFQLGLLVLAAMFVLAIDSSPFLFTVLSAATIGLSLSCLYPLAMTVVNDYGVTM